MKEITFKGSPLTLVGRNLVLNQPVPDFNLTSQELKEITLDDFKGKIKVISTFPSLDTPVCDLQVREFNKKALLFSDDITVVGISKDLPFAQKRFCGEHDIKKEIVASDYKSSSFGINYGLLIKELNLLARSVLIIDKNNILRYFKIVKELTQAPDYEDAASNLKSVIENPAMDIKVNKPLRCLPCEVGSASLEETKINNLMKDILGWELVEAKKIVKEFKFKDFIEAKYFLDTVSLVAQEQGHHPNMTLMYNKVKITLTTHAAGGLTENDFIMAGIIDNLL